MIVLRTIFIEGGRMRVMSLMGVLSMGIGLVMAQSFNPVDATTSASGKLKLISGKAYATSADITWSDEYNSGTVHLIKWGRTSSYGNQINLKPFAKQRSISTTLTGLEAETGYVAQFYRVHEGRAYATNFTFTTVGTPSASSPRPGALSQSAMVFSGSHEVEIFTLSGSRLSSFSDGDVDNLLAGRHRFISLQLPQGLYLARITNLSSGMRESFHFSITQ
jgi:hypothetical protein